MEQTTVEQRREKVIYPGLPLAVYRELAAHLRQVEGVKTEIIEASEQQFDYGQSQVSGLWLEYAPNLDSGKQARVQEILNYYAQIYGAFQCANCHPER